MSILSSNQGTQVPVDPTSPMLEQPPGEQVGDLQNPQFRMKSSAQQAFEAQLPKIQHLDLDLTTDGEKPGYATNMIKEHTELSKQTDQLTKAGDRAVRQLEKAAKLPPGTLSKWLDQIRQHRNNAEVANLKVPTFIEGGYVLKAVGDKIIVESQPMNAGAKATLGVGITIVGGAVGYEIEG